ncbi:MAG: hypothetical protein RIS92_3003 [Verrucomicrobiota bacterium]|jgi:ABC-2 type transport system permease protein
MRTFLTLFSRELKSFFYSPIAYVVIFFFLIATGFNFYSGISLLSQIEADATVVEVSFNTVLFWFPLILIFPLITMRTFADEFRMGTIETLTTAPVTDWQVVLSKYAGALTFYILLWAPSLLYFLAFKFIVDKPTATASGALFGGYLMLLLIGMFYTAVGCLASALTSQQINAAVMAFVAVFGFFVLGLLSFVINDLSPATRSIISHVSAIEHMAEFSKGLIDTRAVVWYLSMTVLVLFVNFQVFQFRKWKA